jgi:hypothetical protein
MSAAFWLACTGHGLAQPVGGAPGGEKDGLAKIADQLK